MRLFPLIISLVLVLAVRLCGSTTSSPAPAPSVQGTPDPGSSTPAPSSSGSGSWTFVVFGDSPDPAANTTTGVSPALAPIARAIAADKPDLVLYVDDLTNASPMQNNFSGQFSNWKDAISPIHNFATGTGIPLYMIRGNHEEGFGPAAAPLLDASRTSVAAGMPANGPAGEEKLSYSFTHKGAKFIATDDYIAHNGKKETVNQSWVDGQIMQDKQPFMFVFGHSPAYFLDNDTEEIPFSHPIHPAERDAFWTSMVNNNVSTYFSGHVHMYARGERQALPQIVSGNGGADMVGFDPAIADPALTLEYPLSAISPADQKVGYLLVTVHENTGMFEGVQKMLNATTGLWETGDTFTLKAR